MLKERHPSLNSQKAAGVLVGIERKMTNGWQEKMGIFRMYMRGVIPRSLDSADGYLGDSHTALGNAK